MATALTTTLIIIASLLSLPQVEAPAPRADDAPKALAADVLLASDGKKAQPGRIPEGVSAGAIDVWTKLGAGLAPPRVATPDEAVRPRSFELTASVRHEDEHGSNVFKARFSYLDVGPGLVMATLFDDKDRVVSVQKRGLKENGRLGYWYRKDLKSGKTDGFIEQRGADYKTDRAEVDRWAAASYDIARLTDPSTIRIVDLRTLAVHQDSRLDEGFIRLGDDPGFQLPRTDVFGVIDGRETKLRDLAKDLVWIELATPDFRLFTTGLSRKMRAEQERAVKRVVFGLDKTTHRPTLVVVSPRRDRALQTQGSVLLQCTEWFEDKESKRDEGVAPTVLPGRFFAYEVHLDPQTAKPLRFSDRSTADLYLLEGSKMYADLKPADFVPND